MHLCRHSVVDVIFVDVMDPAVDSYQFLQAAFEKETLRGVVIYSELQEEVRRCADSLKRFFGMHLVGVLGKPLQINELEKLLLRFSHVRSWSPSLCAHEYKVIPEMQVRHGLVTGAINAWYQPIFHLRDGTLCGAEVMVRWHHPTRGVLSSKESLALLATYDLLDEAFKKFLSQGLSFMEQQRAHEMKLQLAFKLNASQILCNELVAYVVESLQKSRLPGSVLVLEMGEESTLNFRGSVVKNIMRLQAAGCGLAIDDLGLEFFSLGNLSQIPLIQLKLDITLARSLGYSSCRALITTVRALASALKVTLIIKGIDNREIRDTVVNLDCTFGQGLYLAPPMLASDFASWLKRYKSR